MMLVSMSDPGLVILPTHRLISGLPGLRAERLAELEAAFGTDDLAALAERFGSGRLSARDLIRIIGAGLRGAGEAIADDDVATMTVAGGVAGFVRIAAELIAATFAEGNAR